MLRILIADDHPIVRQGIGQLIAKTADMVVADEASNGSEVLDKVRASHCDVVLLDLSMPGLHGLDIIRQLKKESPRLPILILSMHSEEQYAVRAFRAGASGYLTKQSAPDELLAAIRKVSIGGKYVSSSLAEKLASDLEIGTGKLPHETLSNREYQVMLMIAAGKTVAEIAEELSLSVQTISTYRARILQKMGMKNNVELANYAIKNQLPD
ncbi:MAG: response regulator transcription factor [Chloroflexota bacterium]|nr:MAG: response regulator transcription factor [Chloroflexota bacterium]